MRWTTTLRRLPLAALLTGLALLGPATAADDKKDKDGFKPLFNGKDFTGWKFKLQGDADPDKTFSVEDKVIVVTGQPNGYFYTEKSYKNYVIRFDWRYERPKDLEDDSKFNGNSGCLVHIQPPHKVWPRCIEVQGMNKDHGHIFPVNAGGARIEFKDKLDRKAQKKAIKKVGEWNTTEIISKDGALTCKINGVQVDTGKGNLKEGQIGFQSEGAKIYFRKIVIKEMK
jgi:hypothetical protein